MRRKGKLKGDWSRGAYWGKGGMGKRTSRERVLGRCSGNEGWIGETTREK